MRIGASRREGRPPATAAVIRAADATARVADVARLPGVRPSLTMPDETLRSRHMHLREDSVECPVRFSREPGPSRRNDVHMHRVVPLKVHYYGTPVVLVSSTNPDGTTNIAPMSSAWWLGDEAMLGLAGSSRTTQNLARTGECVLNLASSELVHHVDRLALLTGEPVLSPHKQKKGYRYEPLKFQASGLTPLAADLVHPDRVAECPIQLECEVVEIHGFDTARAIHVRVLRSHVDDALILPGTSYVDPQAWDPLIMKFCDFFGASQPLTPSRLATGWEMPGRLTPA
jgi:flavin reductase (DIM6/NTAB) family NADH-FMN oxidoreductase RutF